MNKQNDTNTEEEVDAEEPIDIVDLDGEIGKKGEEDLKEDTEEVDREKVWEEKYKRALADYQNLEKRSLESRRDWIRSSNRDLLLKILPVLDTLILAKQHSKDTSLQVSVQQFLDVLKSEGVVKLETVGKDFDPHLMEAVSTEEGEEGKVVKEIQAGYVMNEKLLRPALVTVGKKE